MLIAAGFAIMPKTFESFAEGARTTVDPAQLKLPPFDHVGFK